MHTSNLYYNEPLALAAEKLVRASGLDKVFFTNSGTEAIEGAIKAARKYAWLKDGRTDHEIIAMEHSFHGRSLGALSVTGNDHYQEPFGPLIGGRVCRFQRSGEREGPGDRQDLRHHLETVQGEGGIYPADPAFLEGVRKLCDEKDILLILDEIQCGMGRTGRDVRLAGIRRRAGYHDKCQGSWLRRAGGRFLIGICSPAASRASTPFMNCSY